MIGLIILCAILYLFLILIISIGYHTNKKLNVARSEHYHVRTKNYKELYDSED